MNKLIKHEKQKLKLKKEVIAQLTKDEMGNAIGGYGSDWFCTEGGGPTCAYRTCDRACQDDASGPLIPMQTYICDDSFNTCDICFQPTWYKCY